MLTPHQTSRGDTNETRAKTVGFELVIEAITSRMFPAAISNVMNVMIIVVVMMLFAIRVITEISKFSKTDCGCDATRRDAMRQRFAWIRP